MTQYRFEGEGVMTWKYRVDGNDSRTTHDRCSSRWIRRAKNRGKTGWSRNRERVSRATGGRTRLSNNVHNDAGVLLRGFSHKITGHTPIIYCRSVRAYSCRIYNNLRPYIYFLIKHSPLLRVARRWQFDQKTADTFYLVNNSTVNNQVNT